MSFNEQRLKEILKKYDQDLYMVFGGDHQIKVSDIDPCDLFYRVKQWSDLSHRGLLCGIMGCTSDPTEKCKRCGSCYCLEHREWHIDTISGGTGILEKDESEIPV